MTASGAPKNKHVIESLDFELAFANQTLAWEQQARIVDFAEGIGQAAIETVFDRISPGGGIWEIDRLEVDLGVLSATASNEEWAAVLAQRLEECLRGICPRQDVGTSVAEQSGPNETSPHRTGPHGARSHGEHPLLRHDLRTVEEHGAEALVRYLEDGYLPWSVSSFVGADVRSGEWIAGIVRSAGVEIWQLLQKRPPQEQVLVRLQQVLSSELLEELLRSRHTGLVEALGAWGDATGESRKRWLVEALRACWEAGAGVLDAGRLDTARRAMDQRLGQPASEPSLVEPAGPNGRDGTSMHKRTGASEDQALVRLRRALSPGLLDEVLRSGEPELARALQSWRDEPDVCAASDDEAFARDVNDGGASMPRQTGESEEQVRVLRQQALSPELRDEMLRGGQPEAARASQSLQGKAEARAARGGGAFARDVRNGPSLGTRPGPAEELPRPGQAAVPPRAGLQTPPTGEEGVASTQIKERRTGGPSPEAFVRYLREGHLPWPESALTEPQVSGRGEGWMADIVRNAGAQIWRLLQQHAPEEQVLLRLGQRLSAELLDEFLRIKHPALSDAWRTRQESGSPRTRAESEAWREWHKSWLLEGIRICWEAGAGVPDSGSLETLKRAMVEALVDVPTPMHHSDPEDPASRVGPQPPDVRTTNAGEVEDGHASADAHQDVNANGRTTASGGEIANAREAAASLNHATDASLASEGAIPHPRVGEAVDAGGSADAREGVDERRNVSADAGARTFTARDGESARAAAEHARVGAGGSADVREGADARRNVSEDADAGARTPTARDGESARIAAEHAVAAWLADGEAAGGVTGLVRSQVQAELATALIRRSVRFHLADTWPESQLLDLVELLGLAPSPSALVPQWEIFRGHMRWLPSDVTALAQALDVPSLADDSASGGDAREGLAAFLPPAWKPWLWATALEWAARNAGRPLIRGELRAHWRQRLTELGAPVSVLRSPNDPGPGLGASQSSTSTRLSKTTLLAGDVSPLPAPGVAALSAVRALRGVSALPSRSPQPVHAEVVASIQAMLNQPGPGTRLRFARAMESPEACQAWWAGTAEARRWEVLAVFLPHSGAALRVLSNILLRAAEAGQPPTSAATLREAHERFLVRHLFEEDLPADPATLIRRCAQVLSAAQRPNLSPQAALIGQPRTGAEARTSPTPFLDPSRGTDADPLWVGNAGLVLLGPYFVRLFSSLGLVQDRTFLDDDAQEKAVHCLEYLVHGHTQTLEPCWVLNKLICGIPLARPLAPCPGLDRAACASLDGLLASVIAHWTALGKTSVAGLRRSFLQRTGRLTQRPGDEGPDWNLQVEAKPFDMLLQQLPWGISTLNWPWSEGVLHVDWH